MKVSFILTKYNGGGREE